ncbi:type II secretion system F family protein [Synechococcus sp. RSCCF101]|uniref:type II secretion system F family protein n=1 Tax=Synechococcus sp. RSCCF101 TaxID=2511069 RepID=UPI0012488304|nr:type II secretion system F family protein [Synechococcus sp. RSCCF101]QEY32570.1 type II secretion system F family protein [Synechococcus sp. RSCCF101]
MASFIATYTARGKEQTLTLRANDVTAARRRLRRRGIRPTTLVKQSKEAVRTGAASGGLANLQSLSKLNIGRYFEAAPDVKDRALFASKLSALVDAGVPIVRGIDLMAKQQKKPLFRRALEQVSLVVNEGGSLGEAFRQWPKVFDRLTLAMVEAGEAGGVLDETLARLSKLLEENARIQNQIKGALGYPTTVFGLAVLVFLGMTMFVIPTFGEIFDSLDAELPAFTQFMLDLSALLRSAFLVVIIGLLILAAALFRGYYNTPHGKRVVDRIVLKLPLFGDLIQKAATAQFCRIFSALTRAGVPILYSLEIAADTAGNAIISDAILSSREMIQEGVLLSRALVEQGQVFPEMALGMLGIGEETGEMDAMLSKVADFYEDEVSAAVKLLTSMLEPAMIVLVGGIVGALLLSMYLPMFAVFNEIG